MKDKIKKTGKGRIRNAGTGDIPMKPEFANEFVKESCELIPVTADEVCLLFAGKDPELIDPYVSEKIKINATPSQIEKGLIIAGRPIDSRRVDKMLKRHHNMIKIENVKRIKYNSNRVMFEQIMNQCLGEDNV
jgi:hypothetical protein